MRAARSPTELISLAESLEGEGALGFLLSGGSDFDGRVPLEGFTDAIRRIKDVTGLLINAHVGLAPKAILENLVSAGVDAFSVDVHGSTKVIRGTLGLSATPNDFLRVVSDLEALGAQVVAPHVCIGLEPGDASGELNAIRLLGSVGVKRLVLIAFTPTKGTPYETLPPPAPEEILEVVRFTRAQMPDTRLLLGCMRPRSTRSYEVEAVAAGVDGIAMPSNDTLRQLLRQGVHLEERPICCAFC